MGSCLPKPGEEQGDVSLLLFQEGNSFRFVPDAHSVLAASDIELTLPQGGAVDVHVKLAGKPVAEAAVVLSWIASGESAKSRSHGIPFWFDDSVKTDAQGQFRFTGIGPGRYQVRLTRPFSSPRHGVVTLAHQDIVVLPGETVSHEFDRPPGHTLTGTTVSSADGRPLSNCEVLIAKSDEPVGFLDAMIADSKGRFSVADLQPGLYALRASQAKTNSDGGRGKVVAVGYETITIVDSDAAVTIKLPSKRKR